MISGWRVVTVFIRPLKTTLNTTKCGWGNWSSVRRETQICVRKSYNFVFLSTKNVFFSRTKAGIDLTCVQSFYAICLAVWLIPIDRQYGSCHEFLDDSLAPSVMSRKTTFCRSEKATSSRNSTDRYLFFADSQDRFRIELQ